MSKMTSKELEVKLRSIGLSFFIVNFEIFRAREVRPGSKKAKENLRVGKISTEYDRVSNSRRIFSEKAERRALRFCNKANRSRLGSKKLGVKASFVSDELDKLLKKYGS